MIVASLVTVLRLAFGAEPSPAWANVMALPAVLVVALFAGLLPGLLCTGLIALGDVWLFNGLTPAEGSAGTHSLLLLAPSLLTLVISESYRRWWQRAHDGCADDQPAIPAQIGEGATRRTKEAHGRFEHHLAAEHAVTRILAESNTLEDAAPRVLQALCENLVFDVGQMWCPDERDGLLRCSDVWSVERFDSCEFVQCSRDIALPSGVGLPGRVWTTRAPAWISDVAQDGNFPRAAHAAAVGLSSGCAFPLITGQEFFGVMEFFAPQIAVPDARLLNMMARVGSEIGQFIRRKQAEARLQTTNLELGAANRELNAAQLELQRQNEELRRARAEIEAERARYESLFQFAPDGYIVSDLVGTILEGNCSAAEQLGVEPAHLAGTALPSLVHINDRKMFQARLREFSEHQSSNRPAQVAWELRMAPVTGKRFDAALTVAAVGDATGHPVALRWLIHDITKRKRAEADLAKHLDQLEDIVKRRTAELEASHQKLRQSERMTLLGTLANGLGHDVGNLAFPMLCRLDTLAAQRLPEQAQQDVAAVRESVMHLRDLAAGLSVFARDPDDPVHLMAVTRIPAWWEDAQRKLLKALPSNVLLQSEFPEELPAVAISSHQLTLAIRNLVINSSESMSAPNGVVRIWARASDDLRSVHIGVTDNGRGMSEEVRQHAIEPFFTTKKRRLSTGLGLSTVHGIVEAIDGTMEIESLPGRGTTVVITLPVAAEPVEAPSDPEMQRGASISLQDQWLASYAAALLKSASFHVSRNGPPDTGEEVLWITETAMSGPETILRFLGDRADRRAIVIGQPSAQWNEPRIDVIDGSHRAMQKALEKAVVELT